jgi:PAS domain S-box-containing protein
MDKSNFALFAALPESEQRYRILVETSHDVIWSVDSEGRITFMNAASRRVYGREPEEMIGRHYLDFVPPELHAKEQAFFAQVVQSGTDVIVDYENHVYHKDGSIVVLSANARILRDDEGRFLGSVGSSRDITALKRSEQAMREAEEKLRAIFDGARDGILVVDAETRKLLVANAAMCNMLGYTNEEIVCLGVLDLHPQQDLSRAIAPFDKMLRGEIDLATDIPILRKDGSTFHADIKAAPIRFGGKNCMLGIFRDITENKKALEALAIESRRSQAFLRNASDGVHILDTNGTVLEVSDSFCGMLGYSREELIGANVSLWDAQWSPPELKQIIVDQIARRDRSIFNTKHRRRDGSLVDVEVTGLGLELDGKPVLFNSARDITERLRTERQLVDAEAQFRGLVEQSIAGYYVIQNDKFAYVNPRFAEIFGYASPAELVGRDSLSYVVEKDRGAVLDTRRLIEGGSPSKDLNFTGMRKDGTMIQIGAHSSRATYQGQPAVIGLVQDISEKTRAEDEIKRYVSAIQNAFMSTVEVARTLSEMRDPYTAGHERRVGRTAAAIGAELGFDERRIEGLRVAGYLHDIGKITIPAEILSKPTKLSPIEFRLIQGHPQAGYEVLKAVTFPWPVAEVALQHHERMDGTGYPQGLKGEAILLEARIMAVADVVEAISSHRPYRPGLGIEKALAEIVRGRGSAYDPTVADACLRLFRERLYRLEQTSDLRAAITSATKDSQV